MFIKNNERTSLLRYWTSRYLLTLCVGLVIIGIISTIWMRYITIEKRLEFMRLFAAEIADRVVDTDGNLRIGRFLPRLIDERQRFLKSDSKLIVLILDKNGGVAYSQPNGLPHDLLQTLSLSYAAEEGTAKIRLQQGETLYLVNKKIKSNQGTLGWVDILYPEQGISRDTEDLKLLLIMLVSLALLGWGVIYLLTRKLSKPIKDVADAAKQIVAGNYDVQLEKNIKEKEVYDLIQSFRDMAERLGQLETLRTELLAGVTHELKTPVASISGLIQAVKDEIVTGEEAKEFLEICAKEISRLQKMVEDLLHFNSFAVGAVRVHRELQNMNQLVREITHQWLLVQDENGIELNTRVPDESLFACTDALRIKQILVNLLNNAKQAIGVDGKIDVVLYENEGEISPNFESHVTSNC